MKNSLKAIVAVVLLFSATLSANAQFDNNRVTKRFHFGIRGGITSNTFSDSEGVDPLVFPTGGFAFDFQLAPVPVFLGFGVNYMNEGFKYKHSDETENASAIHMPLVFGYHFNVAPNLFVSPYMGSFMSYCVDDDIPIIRDDQFNYGLRFGCGLNFGRLTFDMAYEYGLDEKRYDARTGTFFATIGFNIAGER